MGYLIVSEMEKCGASRAEISSFIRQSGLEKVAKGLYVSPDAAEDDWFALQYRYPRAVFSHESALFLLGQAERAPIRPTVTLPQSASASGLKDDPVTVRKVKDKRFEVGLTDATTMFDHKVRTYDIERTICDLFRSRRTVDSQDLLSAFRGYMRSMNRNVPKLMRYAKLFRMTNVMRPYLEAVMGA